MRLTRIDPARNMARFYELHLQPTLFGEISLIRRWGRIGCGGRAMVETHATDVAAHDALARRRRQKERRGYAPSARFIELTAQCCLAAEQDGQQLVGAKRRPACSRPS